MPNITNVVLAVVALLSAKCNTLRIEYKFHEKNLDDNQFVEPLETNKNDVKIIPEEAFYNSDNIKLSENRSIHGNKIKENILEEELTSVKQRRTRQAYQQLYPNISSASPYQPYNPSVQNSGYNPTNLQWSQQKNSYGNNSYSGYPYTQGQSQGYPSYRNSQNSTSSVQGSFGHSNIGSGHDSFHHYPSQTVHNMTLTGPSTVSNRSYTTNYPTPQLPSHNNQPGHISQRPNNLNSSFPVIHNVKPINNASFGQYPNSQYSSQLKNSTHYNYSSHNRPYHTQNGEYPTPSGHFSTPNRQYSASNGQYPTPNGQYSTSNGQYPTPNGQYSTTNGQYPMPNGQYSTSNGQYPTPNGQYSTYNGQYSTSNGQYSTSNGHYPTPGVQKPTAYAQYPTSYGQHFSTNAQHPSAINGKNLTSIPQYSPSNGQYSQSNGPYSSSNGQHSPSNEQYSLSYGHYSPSNGPYSPSNGSYSPSNGQYSPSNG